MKFVYKIKRLKSSIIFVLLIALIVLAVMHTFDSFRLTNTVANNNNTTNLKNGENYSKFHLKPDANKNKDSILKANNTKLVETEAQISNQKIPGLFNEGSDSGTRNLPTIANTKIQNGDQLLMEKTASTSIPTTANQGWSSLQEKLAKSLQVFNELGNLEAAGTGTNYFLFFNKISTLNLDISTDTKLRNTFTKIQEKKKDHERNSKSTVQNVRKQKKTPIKLASIACGDRSYQLAVMLKSALLFSQDSALHSIIFVDQDSLVNVAVELLELKWTADALAWDFTFEIHLEWFPEIGSVKWKDMFAKCATERLFFPYLLPDVETLIFLDLDIIIVSNLTELWLQIPNKMKNTKLAALAPNNEPTASSWYDGNEIPHYGPKGLNAGVMLMNLTQMREFHFEEKSIGAQALYDEHIKLADQDILNIIFSAFPERLLELDCSYNFNWVHCGGSMLGCVNDGTKENLCFCRSVKSDGAKIVHGNGGTFGSNFEHHLFLPQMFSAFQKLDLMMDSYLSMIANLKSSFNKLNPRPCFPLTADLLYGNAQEYLANLKQFKTH